MDLLAAQAKVDGSLGLGPVVGQPASPVPASTDSAAMVAEMSKMMASLK